MSRFVLSCTKNLLQCTVYSLRINIFCTCIPKTICKSLYIFSTYPYLDNLHSKYSCFSFLLYLCKFILCVLYLIFLFLCVLNSCCVYKAPLKKKARMKSHFTEEGTMHTMINTMTCMTVENVPKVHIFKCLVLSDWQSNTPRYSVY